MRIQKPRQQATTPRPAKMRTTQQCQRILDAAERCFIDSGFHAASMAHIAATAGMSAGLIYRYFVSKNTIVKAIIARNLEREASGIINHLNSPEGVTEALLDVFERWRRGDDPKMNATLMLELTAESTRDPEIARAVRDKDRSLGLELTQAVRRIAQLRGVTLTPAVARGRAIVLHCLVEGLASRAVRDPQLRRSTLKPVLEQTIAALLG